MLSKLINNLITFFSSRGILFAFLLFLLLSFFGLGIFKINVNESIFSMLPKGNSFTEFSKLIEQGELTNQVVFTLKVGDLEPDELSEITSIFSDSINNRATGYLKAIVIERASVEGKVFNYFYENFPEFIDEEYYNKIENKINKDSLSVHLTNAQRNLLAPGAFMYSEFILKDPLSISGDFFNSLNEKNNSSNLNMQDGFVYTGD